MGYRIALTYNLKRGGGARRDGEELGDADSEFDSRATIEAIADALRAGGHCVALCEADRSLADRLKAHPVDLVFNIAEGLTGESRESHVPALLDVLDIPYTGSDAVTLALALDKFRTKQVLAYEGVPVPRGQLFRTGHEPLDSRLSFPLIVKPNREGSAIGITRESVVHDALSLCRQVQRVRACYRQEALAEEFVEGTELTVGVLGTEHPTALPVLEIDFAACRPSGEYFYSWRVKEFQGDVSRWLAPRLHCPARLEPETARRVQCVAVRAHRALGCADCSRTDIRLAADGTPYVLEVNPLPGLDPIDSNLTRIARAAGLAYHELINGMVNSAMARHGRRGWHRAVALPSGRGQVSVPC